MRKLLLLLALIALPASAKTLDNTPRTVVMTAFYPEWQALEHAVEKPRTYRINGLVFLTVAMIPLTFSIANGLAFGLTAHAVLKLVRGQLRRQDWLLLVLAGLFVFRFIWLSGAG